MLRITVLILAIFTAAINAARVNFAGPHVLGSAVGHGQGALTSADIDGDGKIDIITPQKPYPVGWRPSTNPTKAYPIATEKTSTGCEIHAADMDGDGDADVITPSGNIGSAPRWFENPRPSGDPKNGPWKAHGPAKSSGEVHDMDVCDINNDGKMDVASRHKNSTLHVLFQTSGGWTHKSINLAGEEGTAFGDIDGDGDMDITDGTAWYETPSNILSGGSWTKHTFGNFGCSLRRACIADWNKDGNPDIAVSVAEFQKCPLIVYFAPDNPKTGNWKEHKIYSEARDYNFHTLEAADFDLDGHLDLLIGTTHGDADNAFEKIMRILWNDGTSTCFSKDNQWNKATAQGMWQAQVADIGSDGDWDILNCDYHRTSGQIEFWENTANPGGTEAISANKATQPAAKKLYSISNGQLKITSTHARALNVRGRTMKSSLRNAGVVLIADKQTGRISRIVNK